jgi:hypothetical protein
MLILDTNVISKNVSENIILKLFLIIGDMDM